MILTTGSGLSSQTLSYIQIATMIAAPLCIGGGIFLFWLGWVKAMKYAQQSAFTYVGIALGMLGFFLPSLVSATITPNERLTDAVHGQTLRVALQDTTARPMLFSTEVSLSGSTVNAVVGVRGDTILNAGRRVIVVMDPNNGTPLLRLDASAQPGWSTVSSQFTKPVTVFLPWDATAVDNQGNNQRQIRAAAVGAAVGYALAGKGGALMGAAGGAVGGSGSGATIKTAIPAHAVVSFLLP